MNIPTCAGKILTIISHHYGLLNYFSYQELEDEDDDEDEDEEEPGTQAGTPGTEVELLLWNSGTSNR